MEDRSVDAALNMFDPAFTFSDLLADGHTSGDTGSDTAAPSLVQPCASTPSIIPVQYEQVGEQQLQQGAQPGLRPAAKCQPEIPAYKQRARATQARFRLRQKVLPEQSQQVRVCLAFLSLKTGESTGETEGCRAADEGAHETTAAGIAEGFMVSLRHMQGRY